jgi:transposase
MESKVQALYPHCCGLDVHKDTVVACIAHLGNDGVSHEVVRQFGTMTRDLLALADWLAEQHITHVAMESTGVYWKPIWNLLEGHVTVWLVNARHVKNVPGRKTDVKDCQWIAHLMQHGLLKPSFVPPRPQRELRDLTRGRSQLVADKSRVANRVQKVLEDANIKLASVATDVLGASGRDMIRALIEGKSDPGTMAELARFRLRNKIPELTAALAGRVTDHHRFMLKSLMEQLEWLEQHVKSMDERIEAVMSPLEKEAITRLDDIPGIDQRAAQNIIAEIGVDMSRFPSAADLASWAGMCPGNHQSAGKRKSGRCTDGNRFLKATLTQCAWSASRSKDTYLSAQYRRLAKRRGAKRAAMAVAHSQLQQAYHMLRDSVVYQELGGAYFDRLDPKRRVRQLVGQLERMGYKVVIEQAA